MSDNGIQAMLKIISQEAKKYGLRAAIADGEYALIDSDRVCVFASPSSEEISAYLGRLEIARRFK